MNPRNIILIGTVIITTVLMLIMGSGMAMAGPGGQGNCSAGACEKYEGTGPFTVSAPEGMVVSQVWIKTGMATGGCLLFTENTTACYSISGIGTGSVSVSKLGSGSECQDISHIEVCYTTATNPINPENPPVVGGVTEGPVTGGQAIAPVVGGVTTSPTAGTTGSLPETGLAVLVPITGAAMAAAGYWLRRRG